MMNKEMELMTHYQVVDKLMRDRFSNYDNVCGIEIGTKCGDVTRTILWALPQCQLYTIDPWEHRDKAEFEAGEPQEYHNANREAAEQRLLLPEFEGRVVILAMTSKLAHKWIINKNPEMLFDFVWIDGDHSEEGIKTDMELYYPLVKPGGLFGGHDFGLVHPLTEIVQERFGDRITSAGDFTWYITK